MRKIALVAALGLGLAACSADGSFGGFNKSQVGTGLGAVLGGIAGAQFGGGTGQLIAVGVGTLAGAVLGGSVGASLDRADQLYLNRATQNTLETGRSNQRVPFVNPDTGFLGSVTPYPVQTTTLGLCREFTTDVVIEGRSTVAHGTACRDGRGIWRIR